VLQRGLPGGASTSPTTRIIPLKERVVDRYYDPVAMIWRAITGKNGKK
jgi:hypothetical protein